jgi:hypothetical protein
MLDKKSFRAKLKRLDTASTSLKGQQAECLTYSVYALGALYTPPDFQLSPDGTLYAARYFAEAQSLLGSLLGVSSLKIVQAALLMVCLSLLRRSVILSNLMY